LHSHYPYDWPHGEPHDDHRILHAVEAAEKALLRAVDEEVNSLFHDLKTHDEDDPHPAKKEKAATSVKSGVEKGKKKVEDVRDHRRGWLSGDLSIEDYTFEYYDLE
jgi:hypothetical protein